MSLSLKIPTVLCVKFKKCHLLLGPYVAVAKPVHVALSTLEIAVLTTLSILGVKGQSGDGS